MAKKKKPSVISIVFMSLMLVGLVLVIVGMCTGILSYTSAKLAEDEFFNVIKETKPVTLFDDVWELLAKAREAASQYKVDVTIPSRTFTIIAFVVAIVGAVVLLAHSALKVLGKEVKFLGLVSGAVTVVGAILILVAGLVLAGQFNEYFNKGIDLYSAGVGTWLGFVGGLVAGACGILSALNVGSKK